MNAGCRKTKRGPGVVMNKHSRGKALFAVALAVAVVLIAFLAAWRFVTRLGAGAP